MNVNEELKAAEEREAQERAAAEAQAHERTANSALREQRRYEVAKELFVQMQSDPVWVTKHAPRMVARVAARRADALLGALEK